MPIIDVAVLSSMRRGEILSLKWKNIDFERKRAFLPITKNGQSRFVPLNETIIQTLQELPRNGERVFPITDNAVRQAWDRLRRRAGI